ncbi:MAG TPA: hypothetical protein VMP03_09010, partial [Methylomirabilota bacterium]|nr:hypothetical protein [Methylomirabilota bacterium]
MATLAPAVERLFERIDVEARDETLRDLHAHWRKKRGKCACPSLAALQLPRLGDTVRAAFAFQRVTPNRPDWRLSFCGADAEAWIRPGGSSLLSKLPDRRSAVRLRHLVSMAVKHGEPIVVQYEQRRAGDHKHVEVLVLPLASDGAHPDGVFCAVRCTPAASTAVPTLGSPDGDGLSRPPRRVAAAKVHDVSVRGAVSVPVAPLASDIMSMDLEVVRPDTP